MMISFSCCARLRRICCASMKLEVPSTASSVRIATGEFSGSVSMSRKLFIANAFCRIARSTSTRCVAKKLSTPCCTQPVIRVRKEEGGAVLVSLAIKASIAALQQQEKLRTLAPVCQYIVAVRQWERSGEIHSSGHQKVRKSKTVRHFRQPVYQS